MKTKFTLFLSSVLGSGCFAQEVTAPLNEFPFGLGGIPATLVSTG
jgi:hypothetical protein